MHLRSTLYNVNISFNREVVMNRTTLRVVAAFLIVSFFTPGIALALDGDKASYFGGTVALYTGAKDPIEGRLDLSDPEKLILSPEKRPYAGIRLEIPWKQVQDIEYGQKAGRRVGAAVATTVLLGPIGLLTLFSKKRKHYATIAWTDAAGVEQVAILELGKDIVRETLPILKARSGREITYQDEEAAKSPGK